MPLACQPCVLVQCALADNAAYVWWIRSILRDVIGAHLSCKISSNWSEAADDPRVERDAIHGIKPNRLPRDEGHNKVGSTCIVSRCDQLVCHLLPARRTLSNVDFPVRCDLNAPDAVVR
jgi:hypothetical protein